MDAYAKGIIKSDQLMQDLNLVMTPVSGTDTNVCEKDTANKIVDDKDNPGMSDLFTAISNALNPPMPTPEPVGGPPKPWYCVQDVFPVDFPNGHCIFTEYLPGRDVNPTYRQKYTYADGRATLKGTRVEIVVAYRNKEAEIITKPEPDVTENYIRLRQRDPDDFIQDSFRTITISAEKGIKAVIGKLKNDPDGSTVIQSFLFDKDKWTVAEAEAWVEEHKKDVGITQTSDGDIYGSVFMPIPPGIVNIPSVFGFKEAPDLSAEIASLRQDVAAILARLQVTPAPEAASASVPVEDIIIEPEPDIIIEASPEIVIEPTAPDKTAEVLIDEYIRSIDYKKAVAEAIEVALAKVRGRVI